MARVLTKDYNFLESINPLKASNCSRGLLMILRRGCFCEGKEAY